MLAPTYALYGEFSDTPSLDFIHCETIRERSERYDWSIKPHQHREYAQFFVFNSPGVEMRLGREKSVSEKPTFLYVPPLVVHGFEFPSSISGLVVTVEFKTLRKCLEHLDIEEDMFRVPIVLDASSENFCELQSFMDEVSKELQTRHPFRQAKLRLLTERIVLQLAEHSFDLETVVETHAQTMMQGRVRDFFQLLEDNFESSEPIEFYANKLAISPVQLTRICRAVTGMPPHKLITARRILEAKRLLKFTNQSVSQIAERLSFANIAYFSRFFKKHVGQTPGAFRRSNTGK